MAALISSTELLSVRRTTAAPMRRSIVTKAAERMNTTIDLKTPTVVTSVNVADMATPMCAYCRCWKTEKFPLCDGKHAAHNKATGDNVGPLLVNK